MDFDDESDLTSLEDEDEQGDAVAHSFNGLRSKSDSNSSSRHDGVGEAESSTLRRGVQMSVFPPQLSPSRIGSGIARPTPAAGLKTYGSKKSYPRVGVKQLQTPKSSPPSNLDSNGSSLTPLASPSLRKRRVSASAQRSSSSPTKRNKRSNDDSTEDSLELQKKSAARHRPTTNSDDSSLNSPSISTKRKGKGKQAAQIKASISLSAARPRRGSLPQKSDAWSLDTLGTLVWVRTDRRNRVIDDASIESFWWPAKIELAIAGQRALRVRVFSPPAGSSPSLLVDIGNPSPLNIVSYEEHSFTANSFWSLPSSSFRSRPVGFEKLKSRWEAACKEIVEEDTRVNDGFPRSLAGLLSQSTGNNDEAEHDSASRASAEHVVELSTNSPERESWSPPPPDPNVTVPGEHVLSTTRAKGYVGKFYPAKVIAYVAPESPDRPPKYTVHFMDNLHEDVTRDMFYIYEQEEFGTCKLGVFESSESLNEKDSEDDLDEDIFSETTKPIVIPEPSLLPIPSEKFCELTMLEQSSYIIPILKKISENNYKPAEERVTAFFNGGRDRVKMSREAPQKGVLTRIELNQLARIIKCWALGIDPPNDETQDIRSSDEIYTRDRPKQAHFSPPKEAGALREVVSSPDDLLEIEQTSPQVQDVEQSSSLPPSSFPASSTADDSPSNTPRADGGDGHQIFVPASADETGPNSDEHRIRGPQDGIHTIKDQQLSGASSKSTSLSFNDLQSHEKIHFCTDVLLKEAVIQLLLWRAGRRRVPELLTETEESLLHESGSNLASEFDIAHTVKDLRMKKEKSLQVRMMSKPQISIGGTRSRPRNV